MNRVRTLVVLLLSSAVACASRGRIAALPPLPFSPDSIRAERIADGVIHRYLYTATGPWAIHVMDIDLAQCNAGVAVKGADSATGRIKTSVILGGLTRTSKVVGGVNADFFNLTTGAPTGLLVVDGRLLTPATNNSVLAFDSSGAAHVGRFSMRAGMMAPFYPREAVGGRQMIVRDSTVPAGLDTAGGVGFGATRHPRTAAGVSRDGRRLWLVVVDGRQKPYSDGMTLPELGTLMLALGAHDALNLDGGGSTTFVFADPAHNGALEIANHPSDKEGERPVGDAVAIVKECRR